MKWILIALVPLAGVGFLVWEFFLKRKRTSPGGLQDIADYEGFSSTLYNDAAGGGGNATIGYGHLVHRGPINGTEPAEFQAGITQARALELLADDVRSAENSVNELVTVNLLQPQFDALVDFVYNVGVGTFQKSSVLLDVNAGDFDRAAADIQKYVKASGKVLAGLVTRRANDAEELA